MKRFGGNMNCFFKKILVLGIAIFVLPSCVKALNEEYIKFTCEKPTLVPGEKTTCNIAVDVTGTNYGLSGFSSSVRTYQDYGSSLTQKISVDNFTFDTNNWSPSDSSVSDGSYLLMIDENSSLLTGNVAIGSFELTAGNEEGTFLVALTNIVFGDPSNELRSDDVVSYIIVSNDFEAGDNNTSSDNTSTTNTDNTETIENTETNTKKSSDTIKNPKTGVKVSLVSFVILAIGGVSYIVLRKKNYFNKI